MRTPLITFFCTLLALSAGAGDPTSPDGAVPFEGLTIADYRALSLKEHRAYRKQLAELFRPDYLDVRIAVTNEPRYVGPAYYTTTEGRRELDLVSRAILRQTMEHGYGRVVFVGRSGSHVKAYLDGALDALGTVETKT